ncbi:MAG: hypothetical protein DSY35_03455 [Desulfurobacterium sp.]|nr:MAG: hypothetical protein DSY35_03455 [Desulfurobacterium sp.]
MERRVEIYGKDGSLVASWEVERDVCEKFFSLSDGELLMEVVTLLIVNLKEETGVDFTPNMILNELSKVVVCGREVEVEGGNPAF